MVRHDRGGPSAAPLPTRPPAAAAAPDPARGAAAGHGLQRLHAAGRGGRGLDPAGVPRAARERGVRGRGDPERRRGAGRGHPSRPLPGHPADRARLRLLRCPARPDRDLPPPHRGPRALRRGPGRAGARGGAARGRALLRHRRRSPRRARLVGATQAAAGPGTTGPPAGTPPMSAPGTASPPPSGATSRPGRSVATCTLLAPAGTWRTTTLPGPIVTSPPPLPPAPAPAVVSCADTGPPPRLASTTCLEVGTAGTNQLRSESPVPRSM